MKRWPRLSVLATQTVRNSMTDDSLHWYISKYQETLPEAEVQRILGYDPFETVIVFSEVYNVEPTSVRVHKIGLRVDEDCEKQLVFKFFGDTHEYVAYWTTKGWVASFV